MRGIFGKTASISLGSGNGIVTGNDLFNEHGATASNIQALGDGGWNVSNNRLDGDIDLAACTAACPISDNQASGNILTAGLGTVTSNVVGGALTSKASSTLTVVGNTVSGVLTTPASGTVGDNRVGGDISVPTGSSELSLVGNTTDGDIVYVNAGITNGVCNSNICDRLMPNTGDPSVGATLVYSGNVLRNAAGQFGAAAVGGNPVANI